MMTTTNQARSIANDKNHAAMVTGYIEAMQFSTVHNENGEYLEDYELSEQAYQAAVIACSRFLAVHGEDMETVQKHHNPDYTYSHAGHDLFLTREGHGTGFWDRDIGHYDDIFTKYCEEINVCDPYVGDDNLIYMGE